VTLDCVNRANIIGVRLVFDLSLRRVEKTVHTNNYISAITSHVNYQFRAQWLRLNAIRPWTLLLRGDHNHSTTSLTLLSYRPISCA